MLYINVPYKDKDEAKALGASWDSERKSWYVRDKRDYVKFKKWVKVDFLTEEIKTKNQIYFNDEETKDIYPSDRFMEDMAFDSLYCDKCYEDYIIREGRRGLFFGCSTFPKCTMTAPLIQVIWDFFSRVGVNIYKWKRSCWKCKKDTYVYSYFLSYEMRYIDEYLEMSSHIGLGDIRSLDEKLMDLIPSIKQCNYVANTCVHCGTIQGRNYVVDDPHDIYLELFHDRAMGKFFHMNININNLPAFRNDLERELKKYYDKEE